MKSLAFCLLIATMMAGSSDAQDVGTIFSKESSFGPLTIIQDLTTISGNGNTFLKFSSASQSFADDLAANATADAAANYLDCSYAAALNCFAMFSYDDTNGCLLYNLSLDPSEEETCGSDVKVALYIDANPNPDNCLPDPEPATTEAPATPDAIDFFLS